MGLSPVKLPPQALQPNPFTQVRFAAQDADKPDDTKSDADKPAPKSDADNNDPGVEGFKDAAKIVGGAIAALAAFGAGTIAYFATKAKKGSKKPDKPKDDDDKKPGGKK